MIKIRNEIKVCKICGNTFTNNNTRRKTCGAECARKNVLSCKLKWMHKNYKKVYLKHLEWVRNNPEKVKHYRIKSILNQIHKGEYVNEMER